MRRSGRSSTGSDSPVSADSSRIASWLVDRSVRRHDLAGPHGDDVARLERLDLDLLDARRRRSGAPPGARGPRAGGARAGRGRPPRTRALRRPTSSARRSRPRGTRRVRAPRRSRRVRSRRLRHRPRNRARAVETTSGTSTTIAPTAQATSARLSSPSQPRRPPPRTSTRARLRAAHGRAVAAPAPAESSAPRSLPALGAGADGAAGRP